MTEPQIWTVISFAATVFLGFLAYLGGGVRDNTKVLQDLSLQIQRHDFHFERLGERLDAHDQRFDGIDQRFDGIDQRFDGIDQRFDGIDQRFDGIDQRFEELRLAGEGLASQIYSLAKKLDGHLRWHAS
jgi:chromosome segregation ATPase